MIVDALDLPIDTIFKAQTKGVLFVGVVKYNQKFTIVYSNKIPNKLYTLQNQREQFI